MAVARSDVQPLRGWVPVDIHHGFRFGTLSLNSTRGYSHSSPSGLNPRKGARFGTLSFRSTRSYADPSPSPLRPRGSRSGLMSPRRGPSKLMSPKGTNTNSRGLSAVSEAHGNQYGSGSNPERVEFGSRLIAVPASVFSRFPLLVLFRYTSDHLQSLPGLCEVRPIQGHYRFQFLLGGA
jgi:hypothetical protein